MVARLLGIRLLTLEATVLVAPAEIHAQDAPSPPARPGGELADVARLLDASAHSLAAARFDGPARG